MMVFISASVSIIQYVIARYSNRLDDPGLLDLSLWCTTAKVEYHAFAMMIQNRSAHGTLRNIADHMTHFLLLRLQVFDIVLFGTHFQGYPLDNM